jgi:hypothetical protein
MPGTRQVHANVLAAAHQIAQLLPLDRRDRDQRQLASRQQPRQPDRVALIGLDPVRRRTLSLPRRAHVELDPLPPQPGAPTHTRSGRPHTPSAPAAPHRATTATTRADDRPPACCSPRPEAWSKIANVDSRACTSRPTQRIPSRMSVPPVLWARVEVAPSTANITPAARAYRLTFDLQPAGPPYRLKRSCRLVSADGSIPLIPASRRG